MLAAALIATLALAAPPTFVVSAGEPGDLLYIEVSRSRQADVNGVFTNRAWSMSFERAPGGGRMKVRARRSRLWKKAGIYYWHVYRVDCPFTGPRPHTCTERAISPTRRFTRPRQ
jgi:hypothetical protein